MIFSYVGPLIILKLKEKCNMLLKLYFVIKSERKDERKRARDSFIIIINKLKF